tara:strand:+ start:303 stop:872 length:570 start_codon:yes stop_codon:yes gene_type:complete
MDALKAAVLQAEEDSHMRHTSLRQAFNALKNRKKPTQLQGGGGQIDRDAAIECFRKSMHVSAGTKTAHYVNAESGNVGGSLELEIGTLTWAEAQYEHAIYFSLQHKDRSVIINNVRVHGTCRLLPPTSSANGTVTYSITSRFPWIKEGFTPFEFEYVLGANPQRHIINVNVYCSMSQLANAMTVACSQT